MGINTPSEIIADLSIGPTDQGMVRIYITSEEIDLPMDFTPDEAEEITRELIAAIALIKDKSGGPQRVCSKHGKCETCV